MAVNLSAAVLVWYIMNVGVCRIKLRLPENLSLKGKRQVVKSIVGRVEGRFNVAVAEVDDQDLWQLVTIGVCCVSNSKRRNDEVLSNVLNFVNNGHFDVEILGHEIELLNVL